jgi:hypothetical protein
MSNVEQLPQRAIVLWLSGAKLEDVRGLPEVKALVDNGALVELDPSPITSRQSQFYQLSSGREPASFGFFDTLLPRKYAVTEGTAGRGTSPKMLPDVLRTIGWTVSYEETQLANLATTVQTMTQAVTAAPVALIVKCTVTHSIAGADATVVEQAVRTAREWAGKTGLLALCSDTRPALVEYFVNVNNFLAEMGVIEVDEQSGVITWENSLAYYAGNGQLNVNLLGRDAQGAIHPQDEYEEVCDSLVKALPNKLRNPANGEKVIERVYRKEEVYTGDYLFCAPDMVIVFEPGYAPSPKSTRIELDDSIITPAASGEITFAGVNPTQVTGFFLATAPTLDTRVTEYQHAALTALAPTLLHALGVEYTDTEGVAVSTLFLPDYLETHPIRSGMQEQELSAEDEELIISHLRDLGYV